MYFMAVIYQPDKCSPHRDNIIIRMRTKYERTLWERCLALRTICVFCVWLAAWPTCYGVLKFVEDLYINRICRSFLCNVIVYAILIVIFIGEFKNRLIQFLA